MVERRPVSVLCFVDLLIMLKVDKNRREDEYYLAAGVSRGIFWRLQELAVPVVASLP
jgi:hypothetical protein